MRLNIDCVRDIMLWAEGITTPTKPAVYVDTDMVNSLSAMYLSESEMPIPDEEQKKLLNKYSNEQLVYHLQYCIDAALLKPADISSAERIAIENLTPLGHDFIANIRHDTVFEKTKIVLQKFGVESLKAAVQVAASVSSEIIKASIF